jgi:hypothetical protein
MFSAGLMTHILQILRTTSTPDLTNVDVVVRNMVFIHQVIMSTEDLLREAAELSEGALKDYYERHLREELGHARWLADDLHSFGVPIYDLPRHQIAVELAGSQFYLIKYMSPACLLGYMAVLEGFPVPMEVVDKLEEIHGKSLFRTLRYHAEKDLEHRVELLEMIDNVNEDGNIMYAATISADCRCRFADYLTQEKYHG